MIITDRNKANISGRRYNRNVKTTQQNRMQKFISQANVIDHILSIGFRSFWNLLSDCQAQTSTAIEIIESTNARRSNPAFKNALQSV